jgi:hypothetical protein
MVRRALGGRAILVSINGKPAVELTAKLARQVRVRKGPAVVTGVARSPEETVEATRKGLFILYGGAGAFAALIGAGALAAAAAYEPRDLVVALPLYLIVAGFLWFFLRYMLRRNLAKAQARAEALAATLPAGSSVRIDDAGIGFAGRTVAWTDVGVDEVGVAVASSEDSTTYFVDRLALSLAGRKLVLDMIAFKNGRDVVSQAWRRLQPP